MVRGTEGAARSLDKTVPRAWRRWVDGGSVGDVGRHTVDRTEL